MKKNFRPVTKAILPVAGIGTRFLPATKAQPKEMLPIVDKPALQYIVEEFVAAGIKDIIFVTSNGKRALEDHFDRNFELEYRLDQKGKKKELEAVAQIGKMANFAFVRQPKPLGDGHAVLQALPFIDEDEPIAVAFGDDLIDSRIPAIAQLIETYNKYGETVTCVAEVPKMDVSRYGVIDGNALDKKTWEVSEFVEKPPVRKAPSTLAHIGREILTPAYLNILRDQQKAADGEIRLANAFATYLQNGGKIYARVLEGTWWDTGNKAQFIKAQIAYALKHPEIKADIKKYIRSL